MIQIYSIAVDPIVQETERTSVFLPDDELDDCREFLARQALPPRSIEFIPL